MDLLPDACIEAFAGPMARFGWRSATDAPLTLAPAPGRYYRLLDDGFAATIQFICEGVGLPSSGRWQSFLCEADVGVTHGPTERLLIFLKARQRNVAFEANLGDLLSPGQAVPTEIENLEQMHRVVESLAARADAHAKAFASQRMSLEILLREVESGSESGVVDAEIIPALLAADGRESEARAKLNEYLDKISDSRYVEFAYRLIRFLDGHADPIAPGDPRLDIGATEC